MSKLEKTVLVVEDEKPLLNAISKKLHSSGFEVATARTVEQALGYLEDIDDVDVIWLDHYLLGELDGLDFLEKVKSSQEFKDIPVFAVTNTGGQDKKSFYMRLGATDYFIKSESRLDMIIQKIKEELGLPLES